MQYLQGYLDNLGLVYLLAVAAITASVLCLRSLGDVVFSSKFVIKRLVSYLCADPPHPYTMTSTPPDWPRYTSSHIRTVHTHLLQSYSHSIPHIHIVCNMFCIIFTAFIIQKSVCFQCVKNPVNCCYKAHYLPKKGMGAEIRDIQIKQQSGLHSEKMQNGENQDWMNRVVWCEWWRE